jgi:hypothetical protein
MGRRELATPEDARRSKPVRLADLELGEKSE